MQLTEKQQLAMNYLTDRKTNIIIFGGGAGGGKSMLGCYWLLQLCHYLPNCRTAICREELKSARGSVLQTFYKVAKMCNYTAFTTNDVGVNFYNGSQIRLIDLKYRPHADKQFERLGSIELTAVFLEECAQYHPLAYEVIKTRVGRWLNKEGIIIPKIYCTLNPNKNWTYNEFYKPYVQGKEPENQKFIPALVTDNPYIPKEYIESLKNLKDKATKERLLYGNWEYEQNPTALLEYSEIEGIWDKLKPQVGFQKYITVDVARFGVDKSVIFVWVGLTVVEIVSFDKNTLTDLVDTIKTLMSKHNIKAGQVIVDDSGVGGGVTDMLKCKGFVSNARANNFTYFQNLKSECGYKLAELIGDVKIECEVGLELQSRINQELGQLCTYEIDKDTRLKLKPKEKIKDDIGFSPDYLDNMLFRMMPEVVPEIKGIRKMVI